MTLSSHPLLTAAGLVLGNAIDKDAAAATANGRAVFEADGVVIESGRVGLAQLLVQLVHAGAPAVADGPLGLASGVASAKDTASAHPLKEGRSVTPGDSCRSGTAGGVDVVTPDGLGAGVEGAVVVVAMASSAPAASLEDASEAVSELGRHDVVEDGVYCRVDVEHDSGKVEEGEVGLFVDDVHDVDGRGHDPQGQQLEGQDAGKEDDHHGKEHAHHLATRSNNGRALSHHLQRRA